MDLDLKIATQIQNFFQYDLIYIPLEMEGKILRVEVQIPTLEPLNWLAKQKSDIKTYWSDRQGHFTMAGVGTLDVITGDLPINYASVFGQLRQNLSPLFPKVRYYGGIGFSQDRSIDSNWKLFGNYRFVVPRFEIWTDESHTFFACNFIHDFSGALHPDKLDYSQEKLRQRELDLILTELTQLDFTRIEIESDLPLQIDLALPKLRDRVDNPNRINWQQNIDKALATFTNQQLDKIVLARQSILTFTTDLQPQSLLQWLKPNNFHSYHFCFQINPTTAFIGTSPERLYSRQDRLLKTEAIAGTRQRGDSAQLDRELSDLLRNSPKDIHEHQLVVNNLQGILTELCHSVTVDQELTILKLNKVQHLYTQCQGILRSDLTDADILPKLHPTPAVGGFPRTQALKLIQELEPFERGWYAAPVGWVGDDEAEFAVAIRSGLIDRDRLLLFAGAGIVQGSQAEEEWAEIENKIRHFTDLFTDVPPQQIANLSLA
jgi:menaquinone-specific isochorismate synthase